MYWHHHKYPLRMHDTMQSLIVYRKICTKQLVYEAYHDTIKSVGRQQLKYKHYMLLLLNTIPWVLKFLLIH